MNGSPNGQPAAGGQAQAAPGGPTPLVGPESILAILAALSMGQGQGQQNPQQAQEGAAVGGTSAQSIVPQLLQSLTANQPGKAQSAQTAQSPGPASARPAQPPSGGQQAQQQQEPVALSVLRMLGMVR